MKQSEKKSQKLEDLSRFSFFIVGQIASNQIKQGTCFFVRYNKKLFLVTSLHNFDGWESVKKILERPFPDVYFIRLRNKNTNAFELIEIDIRKYKNNFTKYNFYEKPDICVHEIKIPDNYEVFSIEEYVFNNVLLSTAASDFSSFGYPVDDENSDPATYVNKIIVQPAKLKPLGDVTLPVHWQPSDKVDPFNYQVTIESGKFGPGNSGSPVFFSVKSKSGQSVTGFGGVWSYGDMEKKGGWIVRSEYVRNEIIMLSK